MNYDKTANKVDRKTLGKFGEAQVETYYRQKQYEILYKNYTAETGEIDLIVKKRDRIAFVEVKTRNNFDNIQPVESIGKTKRQKIIKTARFFCYENSIKLTDFYFRFDVATVYIHSYPDNFEIDVIENAFDEKGGIL